MNFKKETTISRIVGILVICITVAWLGCSKDTAGTDLPSSSEPLEIIEPAGGRNYHVGQVVTVKWRINDVSKIASVAVELSIDNGKSFPMMLADNSFPPEITSLSWTIDENQISANCVIRVYEYNVKSIYDKSGVFSISD